MPPCACRGGRHEPILSPVPNPLALIGIAAVWPAISLDYLAEYAISENGSVMTKATVGIDMVKIASASGKQSCSDRGCL